MGRLFLAGALALWPVLAGAASIEDLSRAFGQRLNPKVFRIHRDVRFSKDKTPYNTHLHLLWSPPQEGPLWFLGSSPDYLIVGCGKMAMDKPTLDRFRAAVDRDGEALQAALAQVLGGSGAEIGEVGAQPLKRVPKPYNADHPQAELLKRKALTVTAPLPNDWRDRGVIASALATMHNLAPVGAWLKNHVI